MLEGDLLLKKIVYTVFFMMAICLASLLSIIHLSATDATIYTVDAIAIWPHYTGTEYDIYYSIWDDTLGVWWTLTGGAGTARAIPDSPPAIPLAGRDFFPAIAFDWNNNAMAVWSNDGIGIFRVYYSRWNGIAWSLPAQIPNQPSGENVNPAVALKTNGQGVCIWANGKQIYYSIWDGTAWSVPASIAPTWTGWTLNAEYKQPEIAFDMEGRAIAVWTDGDYKQIYYSCWSPLPGWTTPAMIPGCPVRGSPLVDDEYRKGISSDQKLNMITVFTENCTTPGTIYYSQWNGTAWSVAAPLAPPVTGYSYYWNPAVAFDLYDNATAVWIYTNFLGWRYDWEVVSSRWNGSVWTPPSTVANVPDYKEWWPAIAFLKSGKAMTVFSAADTTTWTGEVYYTMWDPGTGLWTPANTIVTGGFAGDDKPYNAPAIASNSGSPTLSPIPEFPTWQLFMLGLLLIAAVMVLSKRRLNATKT